METGQQVAEDALAIQAAGALSAHLWPTETMDTEKAMRMAAVIERIYKPQGDALTSVLAALQWASGSSDFAPGGVAHRGWKTVARPAIEQADAAIAQARGQEASRGD